MILPKCKLRARTAILIAGTLALANASTSEAFAADAGAPWAGPADSMAAWTPGIPTKAAASTLPVPPDWYYFGGLEAGWRTVFDRPPSGFGTTSASSGGTCAVGGASVVTTCFLTASQTQSRAKFEEYGNIPNGPFLDWINLQTGTKNGTFAFDFWGRSVGLNNQSYSLDVSRPGEQYFTFG